MSPFAYCDVLGGCDFIFSLLCVHYLLLFYVSSSVKIYRKSILLAAGIVAAGGAAVYLKSRISSRRVDSSRHCNGHSDDDEALEKITGNDKNAKKTAKKKKGGGLKSLQVLTAILLSQMGKMGARDLLALVATVVCISSQYVKQIVILFVNLCFCFDVFAQVI